MSGKMNWAGLLDYTVQPSDMELFQTYVKDFFKQYVGSARSKGILAGGQVTVVAGLQVSISAGVALMPDGQLLNFPTSLVTLNAADPTNPRIDRIELSYSLVNNTAVVGVLAQPLVLDQLYTPAFLPLTGTPAGTPVATVATSTKLSIALVQVSAGQTTLISGNISQPIGAGFDSSAITLGNQNSFIRFNQTLSQLQFSNDGVRYQSFGSGGGGGAGAVWEPVDGLAPIAAMEFNERIFSFEQAAGQALSIPIRVPTSYLAGSPITMKTYHYSPGSTLNFKFQAIVTLVRKNTDAITSTTNQYSSTNGDVVNTVANQLREVIYDLSTTTGAVNSVGVSPGDLLIVQLTRVTPSGTEDLNNVRLVPSATEVLFA